jgi:mono/diheme cytochrome c family protein
MNSRSQRESFWLGFVIAALVSFSLVIVASRSSVFSLEDDPAATTNQAAPTTAAPAAARIGGPPEDRGPGAAGVSPLAYGTAGQAVLDAFEAGGCVACHRVKGVGGENANIGPPLMRTGAIAAERRPGPTPEAYIEESILDPDAFIMPNCPTGPCPSGVMPQTYGESLSSDQIATIVGYLAALGTPAESTVLSAP